MKLTPIRAGLLVALLLPLAGCNKGKEQISPSQVLAKVNDAEITVHQLNFLLARQRTADADTKQKLLDELVNQELMLQRATSLKLDRDPNVLQAIEFSRRQILAQAAAEHDLHGGQTAKDGDVEEFYNKNPMLFGERKIYDFDLFDIKDGKVAPADLQAMLDKSKSAEQTRSLLNAAGVAFTSTEGKRPSEQMPLDNLDKFAALKSGDIFMVKTPSGYTLFQLKEAVPAPMTLQEATPNIRTYLENTANQKLMEAQYASLKRGAKIEMLRRFADAAPAAATAPAAPAQGGDNATLNAGLKGLN